MPANKSIFDYKRVSHPSHVLVFCAGLEVGFIMKPRRSPSFGFYFGGKRMVSAPSLASAKRAAERWLSDPKTTEL